MKRAPTWEFPNRVELTASLIPRLLDYGSPPQVPKVLDAANKFFDPRMVRACQEKGYRLVPCDIEPQEPGVVKCNLDGRLTFGDREFRGVVSSDTLEHVKDIGAALKEFYRITEGGGWLILHLPVDLVDGPGGLRHETTTADGGDPNHHHWAPGLDVTGLLHGVGYKVAGMVTGYARDIFHVSVAWLCVKE
jgi:SAM-dependent methyltransferase